MADGVPDFRDEEAAKAWLRKQPPEVSVAIAARVALRVFPVLAKGFKVHMRNPEAALVLPTLHAVSLPWFSSGARSREHEIAAVAHSAAWGAHSAGFTDEEVGDAVFAASNAAHSVVLALTATDSASDAAASHVGFALADVARVAPPAFDPATHDAIAIGGGATAADLAKIPLWPEGVPDWASAHWADLKSRLLARNEGWEVWTDWYEARLRGGGPVDWELERARVLIPDDLWKQGPKTVNAEIARLIEEHVRNPATPPPPAESDTAPAALRGVYEDGVYEVGVHEDDADAPDGRAALPPLPPEVADAALGDFALDPVTNTLRLIPRPDEAPEVTRDLANRLRTLARVLSDLADSMEAETNTPRNVLRALRDYAGEVVKEPPTDILPDFLIWKMEVVRRALGNDFVRPLLGEVYPDEVSLAVATHDRLLADFFPAAVARDAAIDPEPADPNADLPAITDAMAAVPERLEALLPPEAPRADSDFKATLRQMAAEVADWDRVRQLGDRSRRDEADRMIGIITKRVVATVATFAGLVLTAVAVETGKIAVIESVKAALRAVFGG